MAKRFFAFSLYRGVLFGIVLVVLLSFALFGEGIRLHYFGEGNVFRHTSGSLSVHFIAVGHGDAIAVRFPDNRVALIDGGEADAFRHVETYLKQRIVGRNRRIDWLVNTHPHADHVGGLTAVLENFSVDIVYRPIVMSASPNDQTNGTQAFLGSDSPTSAYTNFINAAYGNANHVRIIQPNMPPIVNEDYRMIFHTPTPDGQWAGLRADTMNELSPIITLEFGNQIFVLTGDSGTMVEGDFRMTGSAQTMFGSNRNNRIVHLQAGHHGSRHSSTELFLNLVQPNTAIISAGNREGSPHETTINRLAGRVERDNVFITRDVGNVAIRTDGIEYKVFLGFQNPPNLWWLFAVLLVAAAFVCFFNYEKSKPLEEVE
jgi:beta-lactamase superfamily II metal-dependent hydrolase